MRLPPILLLLLASATFAQPVDNLLDGQKGEIEFFSVSPKGNFELSQAAHSRTPVSVPARLQIPPTASALQKVPAVILQHGASGVLPHYHSLWAKYMYEAGYATLVLDSFSARGLKGSANSQAILSPAADVADVFNALRVLSTHPAIDKNRIAIVGFSRGGLTAMSATHEKYRKAILGESDLRFAVSVAHYPPCHYNYFESIASKTPIRILTGVDDDFVSLQSCNTYAEFLRAKGYDISIKTYPQNGHSYDADHAKVYQPQAEVYARCDPHAVNLDEPVLSPFDIRTGTPLATGVDSNTMIVKVFQWQKRCTTRGAHTGHNPNADIRSQVLADTASILRDAFKAK